MGDRLQHPCLSSSHMVCLWGTLLMLTQASRTRPKRKALTPSSLGEVSLSSGRELLWTECASPPPPEIHMWKPDLQYDGMWRWGLGADRALMNVMCALEGRGSESSLAHNTARRQQSVNWEGAHPSLISDFQLPARWEMSIYCCSHPVYRILE